MKTKLLTGLLTSFLTLLVILGAFPVCADSAEYTVGEVERLADGIVAYKLEEAGADDVQEWINGSLTDGAGVFSEWYIVGLSQSGKYDFSAYEKALLDYLGEKSYNSVSREKYALALCAVGSSDIFISETAASSIGAQGIMSLIYGLHLLNNGCSSTRTVDSVIDELLALQLDDGGWALWGEYGDIDVTAMTLQALAPYYHSDEKVGKAIDRALALLSERQEQNGGYQSFGSPNPESASQVLTALSALDIDCLEDERFIKNGNTVIDGIKFYSLDDGSYCHVMGGDSNATATVQAYYSYVSYIRMKKGLTPLLVFDNKSVSVTEPVTVSTVTASQVTTTSTTSTASTVSVIMTTSTVTANTTSAALSVTALQTASLTQTETVSGQAAVITDNTTVTSIVYSTSRNSSNDGYKVKVIFIIIGAGVVLSIILILTGKRNYKNFIAVAVAAAAGIAFVLFTEIHSADDYYNGEKLHKENAIGTVTMTIRCDTIAGKTDKDYIPENGIILDVTEFDLVEGETVYDILREASRTYKIHVENKGNSGSAHGMVYIAGINYIYENDFGDLSGWVYHVNGITPSRGCGDYKLSAGDSIEWLYTCELGHDLDEVYENENVF